ncbi:MAG TPA: alanine racemase [Miltoncostaeaceae bacterium]|nr:alanine racemase [Miltoncostaeaceae bacterium]
MTPERALARVDLGAIRRNAETLRRAAGRAELLAVVKAFGYGHGAVPVARAALEGGATRLGVAAIEEAEELREAGIGAPIVCWGPLMGHEWRRAAAAAADVAVWTPEACRAAADAGAVRVHLKLDSGMGRLGARPEDVSALAEAAAEPRLDVAGIMTHFATADVTGGEDAGFFREQLARFRSMLGPLRQRFPEAIVHTANSAATLRDPSAAFDLVRCGIALYGCSPFGRDPAEHGLEPALSLYSYIASIKPLWGSESVGYGRSWRAARGTLIGAVPIGYGDGYSRAYSNRARVLVGGRSVPVVGTISMDQLTIDLGPEADERVGDEVVLIGAQGGERVSAEELAEIRGTINYEVTCDIGRRVHRRHVDD